MKSEIQHDIVVGETSEVVEREEEGVSRQWRRGGRGLRVECGRVEDDQWTSQHKRRGKREREGKCLPRGLLDSEGVLMR